MYPPRASDFSSPRTLFHPCLARRKFFPEAEKEEFLLSIQVVHIPSSPIGIVPLAYGAPPSFPHEEAPDNKFLSSSEGRPFLFPPFCEQAAPFQVSFMSNG